MKVETSSLWYTILVVRYGELGGCLVDRGRLNIVWWNKLTSVKEGVGVGVGHWFEDNNGLEVGDGSQALFCWDQWIDGVVLRIRFSNIFDLADDKMATVAKMYSLGWGGNVKCGSGDVDC